MITVKELKKDFIKYEKDSGLLGMLKGIFNAKKTITKAVDGISFQINEGEIVGYIGANGAGKSTTIKMLTGILTPTGGEILVNGVDPSKERIKNAYNIGVVFGQRTQLWWDLPLGETFGILKEIYGVSEEDYKERYKFFNDLFGLDEFIKSPVRTLSLGQRMRADITASLLHNPSVLYLDEPTIGLDVVAKQQMREAIRELNKKYNTTVILTTHDLDDIEELCDRIIMIDKGKIIYEGTLRDIKDTYGYIKTVSFECSGDVICDLSNLEDVKVEIQDSKITVHYNKHKVAVSDIAKEVMDQNKVLDMSVQEQDIEVLVGNIYQKGV